MDFIVNSVHVNIRSDIKSDSKMLVHLCELPGGADEWFAVALKLYFKHYAEQHERSANRAASDSKSRNAAVKQHALN